MGQLQAMPSHGAPETLASEILLCKLQGDRLAETERLQAPWCIYCGFPAITNRHRVIILTRRGSPHHTEQAKVDACLWCHYYLGQRVFPTFRRRLEWLRAKYEKALGQNADIWDEEELEELGYNLRTMVSTGIRRDRMIQAKLWWLDRLLPSAERTNVG